MIPIQWTSNLQNKPKEKESFEALLLNNTSILNRLLEVIEEREDTLQNALFSLSISKDINKDNLIGRIGELRDFKKLLIIN